jgi:hypothetical protein
MLRTERKPRFKPKASLLVGTTGAGGTNTLLKGKKRLKLLRRNDSSAPSSSLRPKHTRERHDTSVGQDLAENPFDDPPSDTEAFYAQEPLYMDMPVADTRTLYAERLREQLQHWDQQLPLYFGVWVTIRGASNDFQSHPPALPSYLQCPTPVAGGPPSCSTRFRMLRLVDIDCEAYH